MPNLSDRLHLVAGDNDGFDEPQSTTPTPTAKIAKALHSVQGPTTLDTDRSWTALEPDEALKKILTRVFDLKQHVHTHIWNCM